MANLYSGSVKSGKTVAETLSIIPCGVIDMAFYKG
jgi:hypothetical protein